MATSKWGAAHDLRPAPVLHRTAPAGGPVEPAGVVVGAAGYAAAAAAHRVSADPAAVRHPAQGGNAIAHAMVADGAPACRGSAGDFRSRRPGVESADRACG